MSPATAVANVAIWKRKPPALIVVIDTEEEFDWSKPFSREQTSVFAMQSIGTIQRLFEGYGIVPTYVVDYPVASQSDGYGPLKELWRDGKAVIGAHLHTWVTPPFMEKVNRRHSFQGNLPVELERAKLRTLTHCLHERIGCRPTIFKAGRYGLGPRTPSLLMDEGYEVDLSVCPAMDYSLEDGPDFSAYLPWPFWVDSDKRLLEIPLTVGYTGLLRSFGKQVYRVSHSRWLKPLRCPGVCARTGLLNKVWLSPEGYETWEHMALVRTLYRQGLRIFSFAFHSPSVRPGCTPYVRTQTDLDLFLDKCKRFFDFFFGELGGMASTPLDIKRKLADPRSLER